MVKVKITSIEVLRIEMKLLTFRTVRGYGFGALVGETILDLNAAFERHLGGAYDHAEGLFHLDMLSFLDLGDESIREARKA